ncbi:uncharacterized protein BN731_00066 [Prevotella sp. CAG:604]|nr:uncharacterized protein BN731_00066 [Prevotella sp. CAG:604]
METNNLLKLSEKMGLRGFEDECIVLDDERADDIYGGKLACGIGHYGNCTFNNCTF